MPNFPIRYAETQPAAPRAVRADLDVRTGAPEMWAGVSRAGAQLTAKGMDILEKVQAAERMVAEAEAELQISTRTDAYRSALPTTGDPDERAKLQDTYESEIMAIAGDDPRIKAMAMGEIAGSRTFTSAFELDRRIKEAKIAGERQLGQFRLRGDKPKFAKRIAEMVVDGLKLEQEAIAELDDFDFDSPVARAIIMADTDPVGAAKTLESAGTPMSIDQANRLRNAESIVKASLRRREEEIQEQQDKALHALHRRIYYENKPATMDEMQNLGLTDEQQVQLVDDQDIRFDKKRTAERNELFYGQPEIRSTVIRALALNPKSLTPRQIILMKDLGSLNVEPMLKLQEDLLKGSPEIAALKKEMSKTMLDEYEEGTYWQLDWLTAWWVSDETERSAERELFMRDFNAVMDKIDSGADRAEVMFLYYDVLHAAE